MSISFLNKKNFVFSTIAVGPSPALSGTTLTVRSGDGSIMPSTPFDVVMYPTLTMPLITNAEIAQCTNVTGDVLTITRTQEGSSNMAVGTNNTWNIICGPTAKWFTDIEGVLNGTTTGATLATATITTSTLTSPTINTPSFDSDFSSGWLLANQTWTYASATTITTASDMTGLIGPGDRIRWKQSGGYKYGWVKSITSTTITLLGTSLYTLTNATITNNFYSHDRNPLGFPATDNFVARAYLNGSQTINNITNTKVAYDTASFDPNSNFDVVTNHRYTSVVDGYYKVTVAHLFGTQSSNPTVGAFIYKNGSDVANTFFSQSQTGSVSAIVTDIIPLLSGDYVEGFVYQNTGGNHALSNVSTDTYMSVSFLNLKLS